jgi:excisionase family DNA binding protein
VDESPDLLTVREVAKELRVDDTTVRRWIKNGVLEAITLPHRGARQAYRVRRSTLHDLLTATTTAAAQGTAAPATNSHEPEAVL